VRADLDGDAAYPNTEGAPNGPPPIALDGIHVLVVDDEPDARGLLEIVFRQCHARVSNAASSAEALRVISKSCPDIVISDIGMPDEDGYEFIRKVRSMSTGANQHLPAIALTAYGAPKIA
jgi:CheY-like chemotaxis protein